jgi:uncharacterized membrane protein YagU involved in acid resistance
MNLYKKDYSGVYAVILAGVYLSIIAAFIYGWVANVVKFIHMLDGSVTNMFIARIVGIFAVPLGAILGYF